MIDKFVPRESSMAQVNASRAYHQDGDLEQAVALLSKAALDVPNNSRIALDLAKLLVLKTDYTRAESVLQSLLAEVREEEEVATLLEHVCFLRVAQSAPEIEVLEREIEAEPGKTVARYQLSAIRLLTEALQ